MRERLRCVVGFWRAHVLRYRGLWALALGLHLLFFTLSGVLPFFFKQVIDALTALDPRLFAVWIGVFLGTEITQVVLMYARGYASRRLELRVEQDVQVEMYRHYHTMPYAQAVTTKAGEALQRFTSDVPRASPLIVTSLAELVGHIVLVVIVLSFMFVMAPLLAGIAVAFVAIYTVGFRVYGKRASAAAGRRQEAEARYVATAEEGLGALYSVRVQGGLRGTVDRFSRSLAAYLREGFALYKLTLLFQGGFTTAIAVGSGAAVFLAGAWLIFRGEATVGTLVAFGQFLNWLYVFVSFMSNFAAEVEPALVSLKRVQEVLAYPEHWTVDEPARPAVLPDHPCALEVRDLDLALGDVAILRGVSLRVGRGRTTAVVGRSGLGKTTLLNLILGLYPVPPGKVFLFRRDVTEIPLAERVGLVAVVEQEPKFVSADEGGSLATALGVPEENLRDVARRLGLGEFVEGLLSRRLASAKLAELSGGERKRLGIVRGFLREAPLVLLDEPTAFLDENTAATVLNHIRTNFPGITVVVFSHDPLVRDRCDGVIDLERGGKPQDGS